MDNTFSYDSSMLQAAIKCAKQADSSMADLRDLAKTMETRSLPSGYNKEGLTSTLNTIWTAAENNGITSVFERIREVCEDTNNESLIKELDGTDSVGKKLLATLGMTGAKLIEGTVQFGESIVDGACTLTAMALSLGGRYENGASDFFKDAAAADFTNSLFDYSKGFLADLDSASYIKADSTAAKVIKGIGYAVPQIAIVAATGGGAVMAASIAGAAGYGQTAGSILNQGGTLLEAHQEGVKRGALDAAETYIFAKGAEKIIGAIGNAVANKATSSAANEATKLVISNADDASRAVANASDYVEVIGTGTSTSNIAKTIDFSKVIEGNFTPVVSNTAVQTAGAASQAVASAASSSSAAVSSASQALVPASSKAIATISKALVPVTEALPSVVPSVAKTVAPAVASIIPTAIGQVINSVKDSIITDGFTTPPYGGIQETKTTDTTSTSVTPTVTTPVTRTTTDVTKVPLDDKETPTTPVNDNGGGGYSGGGGGGGGSATETKEDTTKTYNLIIKYVYQYAPEAVAYTETKHVTEGVAYNYTPRSVSYYNASPSVITGVMPSSDTEVYVTYIPINDTNGNGKADEEESLDNKKETKTEETNKTKTEENNYYYNNSGGGSSSSEVKTDEVVEEVEEPTEILDIIDDEIVPEIHPYASPELATVKENKTNILPIIGGAAALGAAALGAAAVVGKKAYDNYVEEKEDNELVEDNYDSVYNDYDNYEPLAKPVDERDNLNSMESIENFVSQDDYYNKNEEGLKEV